MSSRPVVIHPSGELAKTIVERYAEMRGVPTKRVQLIVAYDQRMKSWGATVWVVTFFRRRYVMAGAIDPRGAMQTLAIRIGVQEEAVIRKEWQ